MSIKLNRVRKLSTTGRYPRTFELVLKRIPSELIDGLTARQVSSVIDLICRAFGDGAAARARQQARSNTNLG